MEKMGTQHSILRTGSGSSVNNGACHPQVHWTGRYGARFQEFPLAQANSAKIALSYASRQPVKPTVGRLNYQLS